MYVTNQKFRDRVIFKKFQYMDGHECTAFKGELYVDGKPVAHVRNDGNGGETDIDYIVKGGMERETIKNEVERNSTILLNVINQTNVWDDVIKHLSNGGLNSLFEGKKMDIEYIISELAEDEILKQKISKTVKKFQANHIVIMGANNSILTQKYKNSFASYSKNPLFAPIIQKHVNELKAKGFKVLNTNLTRYGIVIQ